jgi:ubiquinone biosynthesis UbiH/UbiF/VisC/COQ6 family hydroxylase
MAISPASRAVLSAAGAWSLLPASHMAPFRRMRVWRGDDGPGGRESISFDAADNGLAELGHIVDEDWLRATLWQQAGASPRISILAGREPSGLRIGQAEAVIALAGKEHVSARLVVAADGAGSWVREQVGIGVRRHDYGQMAVVSQVETANDHASTAWQCFTADGPAALLPLPDGRMSLVWSCTESLARQLVHDSDETLGPRLSAIFGAVLGEVRVTAARAAFPLAAQHAHRYTERRCALVGDAAHQIHPLAGQGINLGFADAQVLCDCLLDHQRLVTGADPGDALPLRRYERLRKGPTLLTLTAMDAFHRLFAASGSAGSRLGGFGLRVIDGLPAIKRRLVARAMGLASMPAAT